MTMGSQAIVPKTNMTEPRTRIRVSKRVARYWNQTMNWFKYGTHFRMRMD